MVCFFYYYVLCYIIKRNNVIKIYSIWFNQEYVYKNIELILLKFNFYLFTVNFCSYGLRRSYYTTRAMWTRMLESTKQMHNNASHIATSCHDFRVLFVSKLHLLAFPERLPDKFNQVDGNLSYLQVPLTSR